MEPNKQPALASNITLITLYRNNQMSISNSIKSYNNAMSFSRVLRIILWCLLPIAAIAGWLVAVNLDKNLFLKILFGLGSMCTTIVASGILILLLKPMFYCLRKRASALNIETQKREVENRSLEALFIAQNTPEPLPKMTKEMYQVNQQKLTFKELVNRYNTVADEYITDLAEERVARLKKDSGAEWAWITTAGLILLFVLCIALAIVALYFMFVFIALVVLIGFVIAFFAGNRDRRYTPPTPKDEYQLFEEESSSKETVMDTICTVGYNKLSTYSDELKSIKTRLANNQLEQQNLYRLLKLYVPQIKELHNDSALNNANSTTNNKPHQ